MNNFPLPKNLEYLISPLCYVPGTQVYKFNDSSTPVWELVPQENIEEALLGINRLGYTNLAIHKMNSLFLTGKKPWWDIARLYTALQNKYSEPQDQLDIPAKKLLANTIFNIESYANNSFVGSYSVELNHILSPWIFERMFMYCTCILIDNFRTPNYNKSYLEVLYNTDIYSDTQEVFTEQLRAFS